MLFKENHQDRISRAGEKISPAILLFLRKMIAEVLTLNRPGFLESSTAGGGEADSAPLCNFPV